MPGEFLKINLTIPGQLEEFVNNPGQVKELFSTEMARAAMVALPMGLSAIKIGTPISKIAHPHLIDQEYDGLIQKGAFLQELEWFTDVPYAPFVNNGTRYQVGQ